MTPRSELYRPTALPPDLTSDLRRPLRLLHELVEPCLLRLSTTVLSDLSCVNVKFELFMADFRPDLVSADSPTPPPWSDAEESSSGAGGPSESSSFGSTFTARPPEARAFTFFFFFTGS